MIEVQGKNGIRATVIQHSTTSAFKDLITLEVDFPRFILAEVNTHKMLSKNGASSRAIPVKTMHEQLLNSPASPVFWGKNQAGMQAKEEMPDFERNIAKRLWFNAMRYAIETASLMSELGTHKQITNRLTEPWALQRMVISGTEWNNFFHLRAHPDAQPEFQELALCMQKAILKSRPQTLEPGEWHVPYVERRFTNGVRYYVDDKEISLQDALRVSASCCAQVSYRKNDSTLEKARDICERLLNGSVAHSSPFEHQGTPIADNCDPTNMNTWPIGVTHMKRDRSLWSANFCGWIQHRQLLPNESVPG